MHHTPSSEFLAQNPPHIILTLLESFGSNMLTYDSAQNDLLGTSRTHFESDFVFKRFLNSADGTAGSFAGLFFETPTPSISLGSVKMSPSHITPLESMLILDMKSSISPQDMLHGMDLEHLSKHKDSLLAQNTIIAASGDHKLRDLQAHPTTDKALSHAVPFYLYIPKSYRAHIHYDPTRIGSHKDILPTLYELSLSNITYMSLGGRNMLAPESDRSYNFGFNRMVWIDDQGIYPIPGQLGYLWANDSLHSTNTTFEPNAQKVSFASKYLELWEYNSLTNYPRQRKINQLLK